MYKHNPRYIKPSLGHTHVLNLPTWTAYLHTCHYSHVTCPSKQSVISLAYYQKNWSLPLLSTNLSWHQSTSHKQPWYPPYVLINCTIPNWRHWYRYYMHRKRNFTTLIPWWVYCSNYYGFLFVWCYWNYHFFNWRCIFQLRRIWQLVTVVKL